MTFEELEKIKKQKENERLLLESTFDKNMKIEQIVICSNQNCLSSGANEIATKLSKLLKGTGVKIVFGGCFGICAEGPIMILKPANILYVRVKPTDAEKIAESIKNKTLVKELLFKNEDGSICKSIEELKFYKHQKFISLKNLRFIDGEKIEDYIGFGGYFSMHKAIFSMTPDQIINEVKKSGLRGRGGAGFPTGKKWEFAKTSVSDQKYVICNGDEGDPGAFMNRMVLEGNPHCILEGMAIAARAIGANHGIVYCRAEYALASKRVEKAIKDATKMGLLGKNIFGSDFSFDVRLVQGMGAFVCGEETALIASIEGKRGEPNVRPPYPAEKGLFEKPTVINNVETLANIPNIIENGGDWLAKIGTETSKGTKTFSLSGKVKNTGVVELPMGTTLRQIVFEIGGGVLNNKKFKAVQIGGPSGACAPENLIDLPVDYDTLAKNGLMMGSGGLIVVDEDTCMVDFAKYFIEFCVSESCGKCTPCRIGNKRLLEILTRISEGKGKMEDLDMLEELSSHIKQTSLCGLGQTAPNPVLSTLKHFRNEYIEHIKNKRCSAHVCKNLINFEISDKCIGCGKCKRACPVDAISGNPREKHLIDPSICIRCGLCESTCPVNAIGRTDKWVL